MEQYIQVVEEEEDEPVELPVESDGTLDLSTLTAQFPGATGLKYRNESTGNFRGVRVAENKLQAPDGVWAESTLFIVVYPKGHTSNAEGKRKGESVFESSGSTAKMKKSAMEVTEMPQKTHDLVILGLAYTASESDLQEYFEKFGQVLMIQIKRDHKSMKSKGFGFVRMGDYDSQIKVLSQRHMICGRWCEVKLPNSNLSKTSADSEILNRKIFVGRCTEEVTQEDLRDYFTKYGEVVDVYIPKPFRAFAFVTFSSPIVAGSLCGQDHIIGNASVHISAADPKDNNKSMRRNDGGDYNRGSGDGFGRGRSSSPPRGGNMGNMGMNQHPGGNMANMAGSGNPGFNMGNFPMNPAMFAAMASQGMFGMPGMMGGMGGNQGGYNNQQGGGGSGGFNYGGYPNQGYNNNYSNQQAPPQSTNQPNSSSGGNWGGSSSGDTKDIKGTGAAGWGQSQTPTNNSNSWS